VKVYTDVQALLAEYDISGEANQWSGVTEVDILESRVFNQATVKRDPGLFSFEGSLAGVNDAYTDGSSIEILDTLIGVKVPASLHLAQNPAAEGDLSVFANGVHAGLPDVGAEQGALDEWTVNLAGDSPALLGKVLAIGNKTASGNSASGHQFAAVASGQSVYAVLHAYGATSGTIDVTIESDATNSFSGAETTRFTFTQVTTTATYQFQTPLAGPITDTWWRAVWTSAATPDHDISVSLGIR
jgi:hypothetical protein